LASNPLISVVDDDDSVRESVRGLLRSARFGVEAFASAEEFLNSQRAAETDCLILDVRMPGMNGLELQQRLAGSHPEVPIIFITSHADEELRSRALRGGAVDYLLKPFCEEALLNAVQTALDRNDAESGRSARGAP
jgi:FixJ family two-component response regulator